MNQSSDDQDLRARFQRLKFADEQRVPGFDDVLQRPAHAPDRLPARRLQITVACCTAAMLLVALLITVSGRGGSSVKSDPRIVEDSVPVQPGDDSQGERVVDIDFEHLHAVIDEQFVAADVPKWPSRTVSLLAVNLDVSSFQE